MKDIRLDNGWQMHQVGQDEWIPATVPGSVYGDLLTAGKMEDPFWKDNEDEALKLMEHDYEYVTHFSCEKELLVLSEVLLRFDGLDTIADITLNGSQLGHVENMHRTWIYPVKHLLKEEKNELRLHFYSPTKYIADAYEKAPTKGTEDAMNGFVHLRKAHCMFGWDWGAHLPDAGIFRPVYLLGIDTAYLDTVEVLQYHEDGRVRIHCNPVIETMEQSAHTKQEFPVTITLTDPDGERIFQGSAGEDILVSALSSTWLDRVAPPDIDIYREYVSYQAVMDDVVVSEGTVIFSYPKYFRYEKPALLAKVEGNRITVAADCYAKSVEILNDNEDLILSDNYFDLNGGEKTVEVLSGTVDHLRLRSVYDIS